jgi:DNA mismatch repair ATPase MutS
MTDIEKELLRFIRENKLSPFNLYKTPVKNKSGEIFKTKDSKIVYNKLLAKIYANFCFSDSSDLLFCFSFSDDLNELMKRQEFFKNINTFFSNDLLKEIKKPKNSWKPNYSIIAVTEDEDTFTKLKDYDIPVKFLLNENDVSDLENYEIVQVVEAEQYRLALEQLPQTVFLDSIEEVYLERYLELLSGWEYNFEIIEKINFSKFSELLNHLKPLIEIKTIEQKQKITKQVIEEELEKINDELSSRVKDLNISGSSLFSIFSQNKLPKELEEIIADLTKKTSIPEYLFERSIPLKINDKEVEEFLKLQDSNENMNFAEKIKRNSLNLKKVPEFLESLKENLLIFDFLAGISNFMKEKTSYPEFSNDLELENVKNLFLEAPNPVSFLLNEKFRCSILTGANSGGKTTLIEHIIQIIGLSNMGLPIDGRVKLPIFSEVYYFAKNKGSASKGAFETLLTQMSEIVPGKTTLILADEIEAVTEPGVAGKIIAATCSYFIAKNCFLIIATHLGHEIIKVLPQKSRIDGIEAKGLDENNELIVDHNPVLGRLANSTPELIVEKMANSCSDEYFIFLNNYLKENKNNL